MLITLQIESYPNLINDNEMKRINCYTSKEMQENIETTEKQPKKESAMIAATIGNRLDPPLTIFET